MDNLKLISQKVNTDIDPNGAPESILAQNHNDILQQILAKSGKYVGMPYLIKTNFQNIMGLGEFFVSNSFDNQNIFRVSAKTQDGTDLFPILKTYKQGDFIHLKDFTGRSVYFIIEGYQEKTDGNGVDFYEITANPFVANINYAYQVNEQELGVLEFIKVKGNEISIQNENGFQQFLISDFFKFEGVSFDPLGKKIRIDPLVPLSAFLDPINGSDVNGVLQNANRPFKTINALLDALPSTQGETYTIYMTGGTVPVTRKINMRNLNFVSSLNATLDFTNCMENDGITNANECLIYNGFSATWKFENGNISIYCGFVGVKRLGIGLENAPTRKGIRFLGNINELDWRSTGTISFGNSSSFLLFTGTELTINKVYDSSQVRKNFSIQGDVKLIVKEFITNRKNDFSEYSTTSIIELPRITQGVSNTSNISIYGGKVKIGNIIGFTGKFLPNCFELELNGTISSGCTLDFIAIPLIKGTVISDTYCTNTYNVGVQRFENFTGKLNRLIIAGANSAVTFSNCNINVNDYLFEKLHDVENFFFLEGVNTIIQNDTSLNLVRNYITAIPTLNPNVIVTEKGQTTSNLLSYGSNASVVRLTNTFKEKRNEIIIRSKKDLIGKILNSTTTYIIDSNIVLLAGEFIEVPTNGLTIVGYGFDVSQITKNIASESIFKSPVGGSGNFVSKDIQYNSGLGKVFDITDSDGTHAIELNDVNFVSCNELGKFKNYRQFTGTTCGVYSCADGFTLSGNWNGFKLTNSNIINFISGGTLIKKDVDTLFSNRLYLDLNFSCQTGAKLCDFNDTNFAEVELFQINNTLAKINGVTNAILNTPLLIPNITPNNTKSRFTNCLGITETAKTFKNMKSPDGNIWQITIDNAGVLQTALI